MCETVAEYLTTNQFKVTTGYIVFVVVVVVFISYSVKQLNWFSDTDYRSVKAKLTISTSV